MVVQRVTRQRQAIGALLADLDDFRSAQQIHALLRERGEDIGLATVYRALADLANEGEADSLQSPEGESLYRACSTGHHHHLICRSCGLTVEIEADEVESWARKTAALHGFSRPEHVVDIFGFCNSCVPTPAG